jgi:hypothetical protein
MSNEPGVVSGSVVGDRDQGSGIRDPKAVQDRIRFCRIGAAKIAAAALLENRSAENKKLFRIPDP